MPTATINPNVIDFNRLVPPIIEPEEEFADPLTPEEEKAVAIAEAEYARGEYYTMLPGESLDDFLDRIESDPEGWLECNLKKEPAALV